MTWGWDVSTINPTLGIIYIYIIIILTQMGPLVLLGKGLVLRGCLSKIEVIGALGLYRLKKVLEKKGMKYMITQEKQIP